MTELVSTADRFAQELAEQRRSTRRALFADGLSGELARLQVLRRLRRAFPAVTAAERDVAVGRVCR